MTTESTTELRRDSDTVHGLVLPLDLALIRWAVVCRSWGDIANGHAPLLVAFLAGWCCRCIASDQPMNMGQFRDSYRAGWREADDQIVIQRRQNGGGQRPPASGGTSGPPCSADNRGLK